VIQQLAEWDILEPYSPKEVYDVYRELSAEVHVIPNRIDLGRRLLREKSIFEAQIVPEELTMYLKSLHKTMDMSIVIELNILSDWVKQNRDRLQKDEKS